MNIRKASKRNSCPVALCAALVIAGALLWPSASPAAAAADQPPNLAGTWKLNKDKSDNPREKMQQAMGNSGGMQGGGGGGYGQRRGGGGGEGGPRGNMMDEFTQLTIVQTGSNIKVTGASGRILAVLPADTGSNSDTSNADSNANGQYAPPPPTVHWQDTQLIAELQGRRGKTTRTYELSPDGKQLYVTTRMENPRFSQPVTYRFVYDPVKSN
ncbi:MAG: hypothetical protein WA185_05375 [Candidatus Acidiferrales bacterium]